MIAWALLLGFLAFTGFREGRGDRCPEVGGRIESHGGAKHVSGGLHHRQTNSEALGLGQFINVIVFEWPQQPG